MNSDTIVINREQMARLTVADLLIAHVDAAFPDDHPERQEVSDALIDGKYAQLKVKIEEALCFARLGVEGLHVKFSTIRATVGYDGLAFGAFDGEGVDVQGTPLPEAVSTAHRVKFYESRSTYHSARKKVFHLEQALACLRQLRDTGKAQ
jgi:hypothetical protein